jgi:hypothetical protein
MHPAFRGELPPAPLLQPLARMKLLAALLLTLASFPALAEEPTGSYRHILGDHTFPPLYFVDRAFSDTTARLGLSIAKKTLPFGSENLAIAGFAPKVDAQFHIWQGLALTVGMTGSIVAGINGESAAAYGASTSYALSVGVNYEAWREGPNLLSGALVVNRPHTLAVSPLNASIQNILGFLKGADAAFVESGVTTQFRPQARYARSFGPMFGVQAVLGGVFNSGETVNDTGPKGLFAVGGDADLGKFTPVNINLGLSYARNQILALPGENSDTLDISINDATSPTFNVGGDVAFIWAGGASTVGFAIQIRTYFN